MSKRIKSVDIQKEKEKLKATKPRKTKPKQPVVMVACVNNSGFVNEYTKNAMFGIGWYLGAMGVKAISYTFDDHPISLARNVAVEEFLKNERLTHLFFIDSDSVPRADIVTRLLQYDKPITSGWYLSRSRSGLPVVLKITAKAMPKCLKCLISKPKKFPEWRAYTLTELLTAPKDKKTGLVKVDGVGAGALLLRRDAFDKLEKPYFYEDHLNPHSFGEDLYFGLNCKIHKVPIYVDLNAFVSHWTFGLIDMRHVKALLERAKRGKQLRKVLK